MSNGIDKLNERIPPDALVTPAPCAPGQWVGHDHGHQGVSKNGA